MGQTRGQEREDERVSCFFFPPWDRGDRLGTFSRVVWLAVKKLARYSSLPTFLLLVVLESATCSSP